MSKPKTLTHHEIEQSINDYLEALREEYGEVLADQTEVTYRKGFFYVRPPGYSKDAPAIPYRSHELKE
jgi:hypothetical protein